MFEKLWNAQTIAARRRVHFTYRDSTTGDNKDPGSLTGKKASIRLDGTGALVTSTNDVVALNQTDHLGAGYLEFTAAELTAFVSGELVISVSGITGVKVEDAQATLYSFDPFDPGATAASVASAILVTPANKVATDVAGAVTLVAAEVAQLTGIKAKTDNLPPDPADASDIAAAFAAIPGAVRTNLAPELARIDATISSRALATGVTLTSGERAAVAAAILAAVIETNGSTTLSVKQSLQLLAALTGGTIAGIVPGTGPQTFTVRSATDLQTIATVTSDEFGNRSAVVLTIP
jgi:hypothetical protein